LKVLGIITEYNPMHNGHIYHIKKSKEITNADYVVLVMSGSFTQTGNISTLDKFKKAKIATEYGVDLVLELPTVYATGSSEYFATGAISLLNDLGIVDYICFGSECEDIQILDSIASKLINLDKQIWNEIKLQDKNNTFAKSRSNVLSKYLNEEEFREISKPNNILGIEYIKALKKLNSKITPYLIKRESSSYNEIKLNENKLNYTSATSIRNAIKNNDLQNIVKYVPESIFKELNNSNILLNNNIFNILKYTIINMTKNEIQEINEVTEGLENRIIKAIIYSQDYDELIDMVFNLDINDGFDWQDKDEDLYYGYHVEKIIWHDSTVVLIGGYGLPVMLCNLQGDDYDYGEIGQLVNNYFKANDIADYIFIKQIKE
jgi:predicted nucleotidyltransferase